MNSDPDSFELQPTFHWAIGERSRHTNFRAPSTMRIAEFAWSIRLDGENTGRFLPYALKINPSSQHRDIIFNIRNEGTPPQEGDGSNARMILRVRLN